MCVIKIMNLTNPSQALENEKVGLTEIDIGLLAGWGLYFPASHGHFGE
jgi:hypothetical protein